MIYGVDVSNYQGEYDFPDNLAFAFAKVDAIDAGRKTRVELIQWGGRAVEITTARLKCFVWS